MTETDERTLGRLEAHVQDLRHDVRNLSQRVDVLAALVEQGKGAKWAAGITWGLAGALASAGAWAAGLFKGGH